MNCPCLDFSYQSRKAREVHWLRFVLMAALNSADDKAVLLKRRPWKPRAFQLQIFS
jgi:hypothetical protein